MMEKIWRWLGVCTIAVQEKDYLEPRAQMSWVRHKAIPDLEDRIKALEAKMDWFVTELEEGLKEEDKSLVTENGETKTASDTTRNSGSTCGNTESGRFKCGVCGAEAPLGVRHVCVQGRRIET